jgi:cell division protein FtsQ
MSEGVVMSRREEEGEGGLGRRLLASLVVALGALALIELVVQVVLMPRMVVRSIVISSDLKVSEQELLQIAGITGRERYLSLDTAEIERRLEACPLVRETTVQKVFPDALRLSVIGRKPLAVALGRSGDHTVPVVFDEDGVVFQIGGAASGSGIPDLPVISGLSFTPALGMAMPAMLRPLLKDLAALQGRSPELYGLISELKVSAINSVDYELEFYPLGRRIRVRLGNRIDETVLRYAFLVIDVLARTRSAADVAEIDLRNGEVVYRGAGNDQARAAGR